MYKFTTILVLAFLSTPANAGELVPLKGAALKAHFSGHTVLGEYHGKTPRSDGYDYREIMGANGTVKYVEGDFSVTGTWFIENDSEVCFVYDEPDGKTDAMCGGYVDKDGCIYSYQPYELREGGLPYDFDDWSSRHVIKGSGNSCAEPVS